MGILRFTTKSFAVGDTILLRRDFFRQTNSCFCISRISLELRLSRSESFESSGSSRSSGSSSSSGSTLCLRRASAIRYSFFLTGSKTSWDTCGRRKGESGLPWNYPFPQRTSALHLSLPAPSLLVFPRIKPRRWCFPPLKLLSWTFPGTTK